MNPKEDHELWNLLGKAREPKVSPYFSRNVLRTLRSEPDNLTLGTVSTKVQQWITRMVRFNRWVPLAATVAFLLTSLFVLPLHQKKSRQTDINQIAQVIASSPDYGVISQLDELLASEEGNLWLESSPL